MKKIILILLTFLFLANSSEAQWFLQNSGVSSPLYDIEMINNNIGWTCGENGIILKTTDGGMDWEQQITNVPNKPLFGIHPVNENIVYSVGWFGTILKTTNGGSKWIALENGTTDDGNYFCVFFINELTGWIGENNNSGQGNVKKTTDGGLTFTSSYTFGWPRDLYFKDSLNGVGVDGAATIHRTTNGGDNWNSFTIAGFGDFYRVSFIDENTGFVIGSSSNKVYKTTDFGKSWSEIGYVEGVPGFLYCSKFTSDSIGWVGGTFYLYKSTNGGVNWKRENLSAGYFNSISAINDSIVWTCGNPGRIWHTTNGGDTTTDISQISENIPESFMLMQNYPNPFNSTTKIKFTLLKSGNYKIDILNTLGQKLEEIFHKQLNYGIYEVSFNADKLNSGIYFYRLYLNDIPLDTKKLILIK